MALAALGGIMAVLVHFVEFGMVPDVRGVLSGVFRLSHVGFGNTEGFLDPESLCLDTSLTILGVEVVILY